MSADPLAPPWDEDTCYDWERDFEGEGVNELSNFDQLDLNVDHAAKIALCMAFAASFGYDIAASYGSIAELDEPTELKAILSRLPSTAIMGDGATLSSKKIPQPPQLTSACQKLGMIFDQFIATVSALEGEDGQYALSLVVALFDDGSNTTWIEEVLGNLGEGVNIASLIYVVVALGLTVSGVGAPAGFGLLGSLLMVTNGAINMTQATIDLAQGEMTLDELVYVTLWNAFALKLGFSSGDLVEDVVARSTRLSGLAGDITKVLGESAINELPGILAGDSYNSDIESAVNQYIREVSQETGKTEQEIRDAFREIDIDIKTAQTNESKYTIPISESVQHTYHFKDEDSLGLIDEIGSRNESITQLIEEIDEMDD